MKRIILMLAMLFLVITAVSAQELFVAKIEPKQVTIRQDLTAEFNLTISHTAETAKAFEIYSPTVIWDIRTEHPLRIEPDQLFTTKLYIKPLSVNPGIYGVPIHIKMTGTSIIDEKNLQMEITSLYPPALEYLPAIRGTAAMKGEIDPREELTVRINLENQNRRELKQVNIKLRSNTINQDYTTTLDPLEKKELKFSIKLDDFTPPQKDLLKTTIVVPEKDQAYQFDLMPAEFEITQYSKLDEQADELKSFLKTTHVINLANTGNTPITQEYKKPTSWFKNIFVTSEPKAEKRKQELVWKLDLKPKETKRITYTFNFLPLFIIILAVILLVFAYYLFRTPLTMRKAATVVKTSEGGISELKILLEIKNRSRKHAKHVKVIDTVPRIAELIKEYDKGMIAPEQVVKHEHKGTLLKWTIDQIEPGEERMLTYKVKSKLSILGGVTLPAAVCKFSTTAGRERTTNSNAPDIGFTG